MNQRIRYTAPLLLFTLYANLTLAQTDTLEARIETKFAVTPSSGLPHWLAFNQYGFFQTGESGGYVRGEVKKRLFAKKSFFIDGEVDFLGATHDLILHEAYLNVGWNAFTLKMGLNEVNNTNFPDELSTGNLFLSINAPTIPQVSLGIFEYTDIPWTKGYFQIKGALSQGILEKDRAVERPLYHEKWAYLRTQKLPLDIHFGFANMALFGGELNGVQQSTDYFEVFFGQASTTSNVNGDAINAAGAHYGIFDYGIGWEGEEIAITSYYQQPWEDGTSLKDFSAGNKDFLLGIKFKFKNQKWIQEILYENLNSTHQSGEGLPDPFINGIGYNEQQLRAIADYDQFLFDELGIVTNEVSFDEFIDIIRFETNFNMAFGGRDSYYVNRGYPDGNTHKGFVTGNALFLTGDRLFELTGYRAFDASSVVNNRIRAQHFGVKGNIVPWDIDYRLLLTFTLNYGTYAGKYGGNINSWNIDRNYFFRDGVNADYLFLELSKELEKMPLQIDLSFAYDQRGFGQVFGSRLGLAYTF